MYQDLKSRNFHFIDGMKYLFIYLFFFFAKMMLQRLYTIKIIFIKSDKMIRKPILNPESLLHLTFQQVSFFLVSLFCYQPIMPLALSCTLRKENSQ